VGCGPTRWRLVFCSPSRLFHHDKKIRVHLSGLAKNKSPRHHSFVGAGSRHLIIIRLRSQSAGPLATRQIIPNQNKRDLKKTILFIFFLTLVSKCDCFAFFNKLDQTDTTIKKIQNSSLCVLKYNPIQIAFVKYPFLGRYLKGKKKVFSSRLAFCFLFQKNIPVIFFLLHLI
jgi:hypothetical protein